MPLHRHADVVSHVGPIGARVITTPQELGQAVDLLDRLEAEAGVPLVDEAERERLRAPGSSRFEPEHWHALLAFRDGGTEPQGYAAIVLPPDTAEVVGDVAVDRDRPCDEILQALLTALTGLASAHDAVAVLAWIRRAGTDDLASAGRVGWQAHRRLDVLRRDLHADPPTKVDLGGHRLRTWRSEADDPAVAAVLRAAYEGTPEDGWDAGEVARRRDMAWFRPEDLLLAADASGEIVGVHWTKRRDATTGEVYNLAIRPDTQGSGLGRTLLLAGLDHLAATGMGSVLLWVDRDNTRARDLYLGHGFVPVWTDLAVRRNLAV